MAVHHLTESLLLTGSAGACGALIAWWGVPALAAIAPRNLPLLASATLHGTMAAHVDSNGVVTQGTTASSPNTANAVWLELGP